MTKTLKLSKNAWGYLVSQYRAVLGRCQVLNLFGTLTVSSLLVLGCAGMAQAAEEWSGVTGTKTIAAGTDLSVTNSDTTRAFGTGFDYTTGLTRVDITGGTLNVEPDSHIVNWQLPGASLPGGGSPPSEGLTLNMTDGTLTITSGQSGTSSTNPGVSFIGANYVNISGGTVNLTDDYAAATREKTYLAGFLGTTISDQAVININNGGSLWGGRQEGMKINGGTINMNDGSTLNFSSNGGDIIGAGATINVVNGAADMGLLSTVTSTGTINVASGSTFNIGQSRGKGGNPQAALSGSFNQTGGSISTAGVIKLEDNVTANIGDGATLSVSGNGYVDTASGTTLNFADNSILEVSAQTAQDSQGVIRGQGEVTTTANAKIRITNAKAGENYKILGNDIIKSSLNPSAWTGDNFLTDSTMLGLEWDSNENLFRTIVAASTSSALPGVSKSVGALVIGMYQDGLNDPQAQELGVRLLTRATNTSYMTDPKAAAIAVESTANMINWTPVVTQNAHQLGLSAVADRLSGLARNSFSPSAGDEAGGSFGVWAMPLYQHWNTKGVETNSFTMDTEGDLGGLALGADYTFNDSVRAGLSLNIGGGSAESYGQFNRTDDDFNFWGLGAYAGLRQNRFGLTADLTYTAVDNDLGQSLPAALAMDGLKSEVDSWAFSAGLRGDYEFNTEAVDITPHLGVRFTRLETKGYDVKSGGGVVLKGDSINQNVWTFPVGVAFSKNIQTEGGWTIKPALDLSIIPAAGDIDAKGDIRFTGISGAAELKTQIMDRVTYMGELGLNAGRDNMSLGLNYSLQAGEDSTAHGLYATFRYEFD